MPHYADPQKSKPKNSASKNTQTSLPLSTTPGSVQHSPFDSILQLQRTIGNRATIRHLQAQKRSSNLLQRMYEGPLLDSAKLKKQTIDPLETVTEEVPEDSASYTPHDEAAEPQQYGDPEYPQEDYPPSNHNFGVPYGSDFPQQHPHFQPYPHQYNYQHANHNDTPAYFEAGDHQYETQGEGSGNDQAAYYENYDDTGGYNYPHDGYDQSDEYQPHDEGGFASYEDEHAPHHPRQHYYQASDHNDTPAYFEAGDHQYQTQGEGSGNDETAYYEDYDDGEHNYSSYGYGDSEEYQPDYEGDFASYEDEHTPQHFHSLHHSQHPQSQSPNFDDLLAALETAPASYGNDLALSHTPQHPQNQSDKIDHLLAALETNPASPESQETNNLPPANRNADNYSGGNSVPENLTEVLAGMGVILPSDKPKQPAPPSDLDLDPVADKINTFLDLLSPSTELDVIQQALQAILTQLQDSQSQVDPNQASDTNDFFSTWEGIVNAHLEYLSSNSDTVIADFCARYGKTTDVTGQKSVIVGTNQGRTVRKPNAIIETSEDISACTALILLNPNERTVIHMGAGHPSQVSNTGVASKGVEYIQTKIAGASKIILVLGKNGIIDRTELIGPLRAFARELGFLPRDIRGFTRWVRVMPNGSLEYPDGLIVPKQPTNEFIENAIQEVETEIESKILRR